MKVVRDGSTANMCSQLAKINKKVDEVSEKVSNRRNNLSIRTKAYGTVIVVDGKKYTLDGKKTYSFPDFHTYQIEKNKLYIIRIDIDIFSRQVADFSYNFNGFWSLSSLNVKCWDTSNVADITNMFGDDSSLNHLDVSGWDTSKITGMAGFCQNASVTELDVSGWDTSKVISLRHFAANSKITSLDVSGWDTSNVTDIANFCGGTKITSLDVSGWDTSKVTDMAGFCQNASVLTTLTFGEDFGKMTDKCGTLNLSTLSAWKNNSVKSLLTLYDRKANGMGVITIKLHANAKAKLGEDGIALLTAKGYTIA
jgi:surface protein